MSRFVYLLAFLVLAGCASANRQAQLEENMEAFIRALKRNDQMGLLAFVSPAKQKDFYSNSQALDGLSISEANIQTVFPAEDLSMAEMFLRLEVFTAGQVSVAQYDRLYVWEYDEEIKNWFLAEKSPFGSKAGTPQYQPKAN